MLWSPLLRHSSVCSPVCGFPPAWAHWREYSDMVEHMHQVLFSQWHWSFTQVLMKELVSIRSWQLSKADPDSSFLQKTFCGLKYMMNLNCTWMLNTIIWSIFTHLVWTGPWGCRRVFYTVFSRTIDFPLFPISFRTVIPVCRERETRLLAKVKNEYVQFVQFV